MKFRSLYLAFGLAVACSPAMEPPSVPGPTTAKPSSVIIAAPPPVVHAVAFDPLKLGLTVEGEIELCEAHLKSAQAILDEIKTLAHAPPASLTYATTIGRFDDAIAEVSDAQSFPYLMGLTHPDKDVRDAAKLCEPKVDKLTTSLYLDDDLAAAIKGYAAKGEPLVGERARLLSDVLRDFRRNGLELSKEKQQQLRALNAELTDIGQKFSANIGAITGKLQVAPKSLEGLPAEFVASHPAKNGKVELTTDYPDFFPFVTYSRDRKAALELYVLFTNRGGDANVKLLERLIKLRSEKAKLLGYATWADYAIEPRMAKSPKVVHDFLESIRTAVKEPGKKEFAELMAEHVALGGKATDKLAPSERYFLEDRVRAKKYSFNSQELSSYFEVTAVRKGLLDITARMYGLEFKEVKGDAVWHPDVTSHEVWSQGKLLGKFYLDLYSRPDKFKHAAMFSVRSGKLLPDGTYQTPEAALECNFPKPGAEPALMTHTQVITFFHEFGHVLHKILSTSELATYSGTETVRDFVEAPSQMFEEWAWTREVLDLFARHHKTGAKIPDDLFAAMTRSRSFGRALDTQRQLFLAMLDQAYFTRDPGFDTTKVVEEIQNSVDPFIFVKGTHFQSTFGHLIEYDAGYYGYQWALALSRDVLTRFKKEGLLNPKTAAAWREDVLSKGGGIDERSMVAHFLGRESNSDAYFAYLRGAD
jgi:thimet oligopeptidase